MKIKFPILLAIGGALLLTVLFSCSGPLGRGGYESAPYKTISSEGAYAIREYPDIVVAPATMKNGSYDNAGFLKDRW